VNEFGVLFSLWKPVNNFIPVQTKVSSPHRGKASKLNRKDRFYDWRVGKIRQISGPRAYHEFP
jgi:hypothetical protein